MIEKLETMEPACPKLSSQYVTTMEVGGAYAHIFFDLLDLLELHTLIITDIDSVSVAGGLACPVHEGEATSNACLKKWFSGIDCSPADLIGREEVEKVKKRRRIAFQTPEVEAGPCGRTFEDAFMLANPTMFRITGATADERAECAWMKVSGLKKSDFAIKYAIHKTDWLAPDYVLDGLRWLAGVGVAGTAEAKVRAKTGDLEVAAGHDG